MEVRWIYSREKLYKDNLEEVNKKIQELQNEVQLNLDNVNKLYEPFPNLPRKGHSMSMEDQNQGFQQQTNFYTQAVQTHEKKFTQMPIDSQSKVNKLILYFILAYLVICLTVCL